MAREKAGRGREEDSWGMVVEGSYSISEDSIRLKFERQVARFLFGCISGQHCWPNSINNTNLKSRS